MKSNIRTKYFGNKNFYKMILAIALPIVIQSLFTNIVALLDNVMVGKVGTDQMTGVAVVNQLIFVFNLAVFGGMSGAGIFSAQYFGQKNDKGVRNVFRMKLIIRLLIIVVSLSTFIILHNPLINMFLHEGGNSGNIDATYKYAKEFLYIMLLSIIPFVISNCYSTTLKEAGQTMVPMVAGIIAVVVDLVFNALLIFGLLGFPKLGVAGAAIATVLSRFIECGYLIFYTHSHSDKYKFIRGVYRSLYVPASLVKKVVITGTPLLLNEFLWAAGITMQTQALSTRGLAAVAGLNIANTINNVVNTVFLTMGVAISIVVGQLLGAGKVKEAKDTDRKMIVFSLLISLGVSAILVFASIFFPRMYNTTGEIRYLATRFILAFVVATPFNAFTNAAYFTLRSGGKTIMTFIFDSGFIWVVNVPVAMLLAHGTTMPIVWMFLCISLLDVLKAIIGFILVKRGTWLNTIVE